MIGVMFSLMLCLGADSAEPPLAKPLIRLPEFKAADYAPIPGVQGTTGKLTEGELFVVDADIECFFRSTPRGAIIFDRLPEGTPYIYAKLAGGSGKYESKKLVGKYVYVGRGTFSARVNLDIIPKGIQAEDEIVNRTIDVESGEAPRPPPSPEPTPVSDSLVTKFRDAITKDQTNLTDAKVFAAFLADVYLDHAGKVEASDAKNWGDIYHAAFTTSVNKGVPRRPSLDNVRKIIDEICGYDVNAKATKELKADVATKFRQIGSALKEASR